MCIEKDHDIYEDRIYIKLQLVIQGSKVKSLFCNSYSHNYITDDFLFPCCQSELWDCIYYFENYSQTWKILQNPDEKLPALIDIQRFVRKNLKKNPYTHKYYRNKFVYSSLENNLPIDTINIIKTYVEPHKYKETKRIISQHIIDKIVSY